MSVPMITGGVPTSWRAALPVLPNLTVQGQAAWGQSTLVLSGAATKPPKPVPPPEPGVRDRLIAAGAKVLVKIGEASDTLRGVGHKIYGLFSRVDADEKLDNVGQLSPTLFRGAQYGKAGLHQLKAMGVSTLINLRPESTQFKQEADRLGIRYVHLPLPAIGKPKIEQGLQFLKIATDPAHGKVYFHCYHGADRTGAMAAVYRMAHDGWTAEEAIAELSQYRFHANGQRAKLAFIREFEAYWKQLPAASKAYYLNRL